MPHRYQCPTCGKWHTGFPDIGYGSPYYLEGIPESERAERVFNTSDLCVIDRRDFFIRCILLVPIQGTDETFGWGVWSTLSEANFQRYEKYYNEDMSNWEPMFGYLSNKLPGYPDTLNLQLAVQPQEKGARPHVTLEPTEHPLSIEQQQGMDLEKVLKLVDPFLHH